MANYFGYMRISTQEERKKQRFNRQEKALDRYADENGIEYLKVFKEDMSGKNFKDRAEWNKLEKAVYPGDTIVMKDVSRFTREAENGYKKYMALLNRGVNIVFLDNQTISTDYIKQLLKVAEEQSLIAKLSLENTVKLLLYVELDRAEQERLILIRRTKDGLAATTKKSGRPFGKLDKMKPELRADIERYMSDRSVQLGPLLQKHNICRNTFKKYMRIISEEKKASDEPKIL